MSISPRFLDELRRRLTLSDIIGRRIKLTRAGRESKACCPFHHEKTPSFTVSDEKQFYHCFGCGAHGDVIRFVREYDNLSFRDAVEMLAAEAGLQVPRQTAQQVEQQKKEKDLYALLEDVTAFFERHLHEPQNRDALDYLLERGISRDMIAQFRIGFSPADGQAVRKFLRARDYTDQNMLDAGIIRASTRGGEPYAFFRERIIFPVPDRRGRIVAFGGRVLPGHIRPAPARDFTPPKYINSAENALFHKRTMLYGEPAARRAAADGQPVILVEGYLDVIACAQAGINGALAPMGTAVTEEQIMALWQMIPDAAKIPVLCFDGDNAGRKAARRASERILPLLEPGKSVNFAFLPDGEDPDSLIRTSGAQGFQAVLGRAIPLFDFIWQFHMSRSSAATPELRAGIIGQLQHEVAQIANRDVQVHYKSLLNSKISETFFPRRNDNRPAGRTGTIRPPAVSQGRKTLTERILLAGIINYPQIFDGVEDVFCSLTFNDPALERLRQHIIMILSDTPASDRDTFIVQLQNAGFVQEIDDICNESVYIHASFCSPFAKEEDVRDKWLAYRHALDNAGLDREIRDGWRHAWLESSEKEEEKLRNLLFMKTSDGSA